MKKIIICSMLIAAAFATMAQSHEQAVAAGGETVAAKSVAPVVPRTVALVVQNHAEDGAKIPFMALTDALTAKLSGRGFRVINPYNSVGSNQNRTALGEKTPEVSAMELARQLKADGAVTAAVVAFRDSIVGTSSGDHQYSIRLSFNLADAQTGATVCEGDNLKMESRVYTSNQVAAFRAEYLDDLMYAAAEKCAEQLEQKANAVKWHVTPVVRNKSDEPVKRVEFDAAMKDFANETRTVIDEIRKNRDEIREIKRLLEEKAKEAAKKTEMLTLNDLDDAVQKLMVKMREDANFMQNHEKAMKAVDRLPIVIVGVIKDETEGGSGHRGLTNLLAAARVDIRVALFKSGIFEVKDDEARVALASRIIDSGNSPLENHELMEALKKHGSPDFYCVGDLRYFTESRNYRLHLALHSLWDGKIVWEDYFDK